MHLIDVPKRSQLIRHFTNIGLPKEIYLPIIKLVDGWVRSSGAEWTVKRLKKLKTEYLALLSGTREPEYTWIANKGGLPSGPFRAIFMMTRRKDVKKALSALMIYTGFKVRKSVWLPEQFKKAYASITTDMSDSAQANVANYGKVLRYHLSKWRINWNLEYSVPSIAKTIRDKTYPGCLWDPLRTGNGFARSLSFKEDLSWAPKRYREQWWNMPRDFLAGRIGLIQEKGLKARVVAMPSLLLQSVFSPLNKHLLNICRSVPWDYTHDQMAAILPAQRALKTGKTVYSVDISSATDRFPYYLQSIVMDFVAPDYKDILDSVIKHGTWDIRIPKSKEFSEHKRIIKYATGQPMGLNGSFPLFALSHGFLLLALWDQFKEHRRDIPFAILGDDVMIWDDNLYLRYMTFLERCEIPVSLDKCMSSNTHAEFASFLISKDHAVKGVKMGDIDRSNVLDKLTNMTIESVRRLDPVSRVWAAVTDVLGGPGFQGGGIPLDPIRADYALEVLGALEREPMAPPTVSPFAKVLNYAMSIPRYLMERTSAIWDIPVPSVERQYPCLTDTALAEHYYLTKDIVIGQYFGNLTPSVLKRDVRYRRIAALVKDRPYLVLDADEILGT
jgi:hypothetical protein